MAAVAPVSRISCSFTQPLYTASQVCTTSRSWDKGVLTDLCLNLYHEKVHKVLGLCSISMH